MLAINFAKVNLGKIVKCWITCAIPPLPKNWLARVSVFKNVTRDQPLFQFPILNFEKRR